MKRIPPSKPPAARPSGTAPLVDPGGPRGPHLIVVEESSSFSFPLPAEGTIVIGRGDEAELALRESPTSRRHAELTVADGQVRIRDLGSRNGTLVNGERVESDRPRPLLRGDSVTIGAATLILYLPPAVGATAGRQRTDAAGLRRRLEEEIERGRLFDRAVSVVILLAGPAADPQSVDRRVDPELRTIDLGAWLSAGDLALVLPEVGPARAAEIAGRVVERVRPVAVDARAGIASYPATACDAEALLAAARAAARGAEGGQAVESDQAARVDIGGGEAMIVADPAMLTLVDLVRRLAPADLPVLIHGETGVGKEKAARALHSWSRRHRGPFVAVNCAAFAEGVVESELFGAERGAFSGAVAARPGLLEAAGGGTLFFDEIGELPRALQPKLLRVLESKRVLRVGATQERELDIRIVAATNRNLADEVKAGRFRHDLLFRLNAATVVLPPLRNRPSEIAILARTFLAEACARLGLDQKALPGASLHRLARHAWPGNVRELKNVIEFLAATAPGTTIDPEAVRARLATADDAAPVAAASAPDAPAPSAFAPAPAPEGRATRTYGSGFPALADELRALEQRRMLEALEATGGVQTRAAELIGMPLRTFQQKFKQLGLARRSSPGEPDGSQPSPHSLKT